MAALNGFYCAKGRVAPPGNAVTLTDHWDRSTRPVFLLRAKLGAGGDRKSAWIHGRPDQCLQSVTPTFDRVRSGWPPLLVWSSKGNTGRGTGKRAVTL